MSPESNPQIIDELDKFNKVQWHLEDAYDGVTVFSNVSEERKREDHSISFPKKVIDMEIESLNNQMASFGKQIELMRRNL